MTSILPRAQSLLLTLGVAFLVVACGGDSGGDPAAAPPAAANSAPVAAFVAADPVAAGAPLVFDASTSSDADGNALTYSWDFGNGQRGGGAKIAHVYAQPGSYTVRLTVDDGVGASTSAERVVTVAAGPAAMGRVDTLAVVRDTAGALLADVSVTELGGGATATTGADGRAHVATDREVPVTLKFSKPGYADQFKTFTLPQQAESGYLEATMGAREPALTLADAAAGGTLVGKDGAKVTFAPGTLVDATGAAISGSVDVTMTPIDIGANVGAFPGRFAGVRSSGASGLILSFGTVEFALSKGGAPVQLMPGKTAAIEIPIYAALNRDGSAIAVGDSIPLWSLNERTGDWTEEGSGSVAAAATPSGFAMRADVAHFSWWNADKFEAPPARPKPRCLVDTNADGVLEDLTGTGYCWHAGTGPEQPDKVAASAAPAGRKTALAEPRTQRVPAYAAEDFTPAGGGKVLPIPADMDITFRSYAKNGTLFGTTIVRLGPNVEQEVPILLQPVADNPGTLAIAALPYSERFAMKAQAEVDRFTFGAEAATSYEVRVSRGSVSVLSGSLHITGPGNASLGNGSFGTADFFALVSSASAGTVTIEVDAGAGAPGSYTIDVRKVFTASCANVAPLALPSTMNLTVPANASACFDLTLAADDIVDIADTQHGSASGAVTLSTAAGATIASDTYGSQDPLKLRVGIATSGTYRLVVGNSNNTAATLTGLSATKLTAVGSLAVPGTATFADATHGGNNARLYLLKPGAADPNVTLKFAGKGIAQTMRVWPSGMTIATSVTTARVVTTDPAALTVVEVFRQSPLATGWDFALTASTPVLLPHNTDIDLTNPALGDVVAYRVDSGGGEEWSIGISLAPNAGIAAPALHLYTPQGGSLLSSLTHVFAVNDRGAHTLLVDGAAGTPGAAFKLRINDVAPVEPVVLGAHTVRTGNLALGAVKRYGFDAAQGQVLALQLSTPGSLVASADIVGGNIFDGFVSLPSGGQGGTVSTRALYVQQPTSAVLSLYSTSTNEQRASGPYTLDIQSPPPQPANLGDLLAPTLDPSVLATYRYAIASAGKYLLCTDYVGTLDGSGSTRLGATVWGPSAKFVNYSGDIVAGGRGHAIDAIGDLRVGSNTLSLMSSQSTPMPVTARLVALAAPADISAGAAAATGTIAACERRYLRFAATPGASYTLQVTAQFAGSVRIRPLAPNGDWTGRADPPFDTGNLGGTPLALAPNVARNVTFTIAATATPGAFYIVDLNTDGEGSGSFTAALTSP